MRPLPQGAVIGVLGAGQLGRMMALAAAPLGYRVHVHDARPGPAMQVTDRASCSAWEDVEALRRFAGAVDVVTLEWENVPAEAAAVVAAHAPLRPSVRALRTCQDRVAEKSFLRDAGVPTAAWRAVNSPEEAAAAIAELGPGVLKTTRAGYDGKGQRRVHTPEEARAAAVVLGGPLIAEAWVDFAWEGSVIAARGLDGEVACYDLTENEHAHHILHRSRVPSRAAPELQREAHALAARVAAALDYVGVLGVELFIGRGGELLVNELAPRPHNSGHWTLDACACSQFEQAVRAVAGCPLGPTARHADAVMTNLLGDEVAEAAAALGDPRCRVHLYGKEEARPGRKMGHLTRLYPLT